MEAINKTTPKARKEHTCNLCGGKIKIGETYINQFNKDDRVYTFKMHTDCWKLVGLLEMEGDEGVNDDIFEDFICEYVSDLDFKEKLRIVKQLLINK